MCRLLTQRLGYDAININAKDQFRSRIIEASCSKINAHHCVDHVFLAYFEQCWSRAHVVLGMFYKIVVVLGTQALPASGFFGLLLLALLLHLLPSNVLQRAVKSSTY